jgi:hypothetical protein
MNVLLSLHVSIRNIFDNIVEVIIISILQAIAPLAELTPNRESCNNNAR